MAGTGTSVKVISACPSRSWYPNTGRFRTTRTPGASSGTTAIDCRRCGAASGSVVAMTISTRQFACNALEANHFRPFNT